ncbi:MAG: hypothetical protein A2538_00900 [Candidatus Magasanikbacteria bacterium RIFOXYD2_FULL_41_14]|uniref:histidine kinase n=1 Tax=Candidatus Magasanikbacteria bacterium RIFOXYD2_FULL_41_14 TaxID=1798709 RepID=A0A1F6PDW9_9BACT|nr:MAG: hypothetical protein A2538_00900 [Candidatus Magasanikbacteria bacterium RIFOXYD2_FULL_41_14]
MSDSIRPGNGEMASAEQSKIDFEVVSSLSEKLRHIHDDVFEELINFQKTGNFDSNWDDVSKNINAAVDTVREVSKLVESVPRLKAFAGHDLDTTQRGMWGGLDVIQSEMSGRSLKSDDRGLKMFLEKWPRYYVAQSDILLRSITPGELRDVPKEDFDPELLEMVLRYFKNEELPHIVRFRDNDREDGRPSEFTKIEQKKLNIDFKAEDLLKDLDGRTARGLNGPIINLVINSLRNGLKDQHGLAEDGSGTTEFEAMVEGDELVLRVMDDGKGIGQEHLDPGDIAKFILREGVSLQSSGGQDNNPPSTGLGLADAHNRINALGGELRIYSYRAGRQEFAGYSSCDGILDHATVGNMLSKLNDKRRRADEKNDGVRTVFEIRLPLQ